MGKDKEPLDKLGGHIATGIHQVAAATIVAKCSTREELDLAELVLKRISNQSAPRESETSVEAFNRLLDVVIDSANDSAHCGTRSERRARLSSDLSRARTVLIDCGTLAELIDVKLQLAELEARAAELKARAAEPMPLLEQLGYQATGSATSTPFSTAAPGSAIAGVTSADDLGAELYSSELSNDGSIDVSIVND